MKIESILRFEDCPRCGYQCKLDWCLHCGYIFLENYNSMVNPCVEILSEDSMKKHGYYCKTYWVVVRSNIEKAFKYVKFNIVDTYKNQNWFDSEQKAIRYLVELKEKELEQKMAELNKLKERLIIK